MISFFPENNGLLLQLNTFATQHFCKPTCLQYKAFATRLFCNSYFCNSTLLKLVPLVPFSSIAFRSGVFVHMFFSNSLFRNWLSIWRIFSEVSMGNKSFVHFCWWWLFNLLLTLPRLQVPKASRRVAGTGISHELVLCVYFFCWRFFSLAACPAGLPAWEDCPSRLPG